MPDNGKILTIAQVAEILKCSRTHVWRICSGRIPVPVPLPFFRMGRKVIFREESVLSWVADCETGKTKGDSE